MLKKISLLIFIALISSVSVVVAQDKTPNFAGFWKLDVDKSELGRRSRIDSMKMTVSQSETELSVTRKIKRKERDESIGGALGGGNRGRGRQRLRGDLPATKYDLTGKETTIELADGIMTGETKLKAKSKNGKLILTQNRTLNTPRGERKVKTVETWELSKDGMTLTVSTDRETPRGTRSSKMVFVKAIPTIRGNPSDELKGFKAVNPTYSAGSGTTEGKPKRIRSGVVNGKALRLTKPVYSQAAREAGIKGTVNIEIVIDQKGDVMSARAISGHPLLREACVDAAKNSKFPVTRLSGQPVEVKGVIVYNFQ